MFIPRDIMERGMELTKCINGLTLRNKGNKEDKKKGASSDTRVPAGTPGRGSVVDRVTNVFSGGSMGNTHKNGHPQDPSGERCGTPNPMSTPDKINKLFGYKSRLSGSKLMNWSAVNGQYNLMRGSPKSARSMKYVQSRNPRPTSLEDLWSDDNFLVQFFSYYFSSSERCVLAQVCSKWRNILYHPRFWKGITPVWNCKILRCEPSCQDVRKQFYQSLIARGFNSLCMMCASDEDIACFVTQFPQSSCVVRSLVLKSCNVSDKGLEMMVQCLYNLAQLELCGCNDITEAGLFASLNPRIVVITISDCINVADECVEAICQLMPGLFEFNLQSYHVTDKALAYFSDEQSASIEILRLRSCWEITNRGIMNIVHCLPNLSVLCLSGCSKVTDEAVELIAEGLKGLRSLDLSWCPRISDAALESIACDLTLLEELILDRCILVTDTGVSHISTMLSLSALYLRWCVQIQDGGVHHLSTMRNLQVLSLAGCPMISPEGLSTLIRLRNLKELELTNCSRTTPELFSYLNEHLRGCTIIE